MPSYVILLHELPPYADRSTHWDFMLEVGDSLKSWALESELEIGGGVVRARELADHRLDYLHYEGPVSGDRGSVTQWDKGEFEWIAQSDDRLSISLSGKRLSGIVKLERLSEASDAESQRWSVSVRKI